MQLKRHRRLVHLVPLMLGLMLMATSCSLGTVRALAKALWVQQTTGQLPSGGAGMSLAGISCPSANECVAVGAEDEATSEGSIPTRSLAPMVGVLIVTANAVEDAPGAGVWRKVSLPAGTGPLSSVSCSSVSSCVAVGEAPTRYFGNPGGAQPYISPSQRPGAVVLTGSLSSGVWTLQAVPAGIGDLSSVSCVVEHCVAVGSDRRGYAVALEGSPGPSQPSSWRQASIAGKMPGGLISVSCVVGGHCMALSGDGTVLGSSTSGRTWNNTSSLVGDNVQALACVSSKRCTAVGGAESLESRGVIATTADFGRTWSIHFAPAATQPLPKVPAGRFPPSAVPAANLHLDAISCVKPEECIAGGGRDVGLGIVMGTVNGRAWSVSDVPTDSDAITALACPAAKECWVVGSTFSSRRSSFAELYVLS